MYLLTYLILQLASGAAWAVATQPWEVLALSTYSPSGRPGTSPWYTLNATIWDPNSTQERANCSTQWLYEEPPYGKTYNCSAVSYGQWSFELIEAMAEYSSPTSHFVLHFSLVREQEAFDGSARFSVGDNMGGLCAASGFCSWGLRKDLIPLRINQTRKA